MGFRLSMGVVVVLQATAAGCYQASSPFDGHLADAGGPPSPGLLEIGLQEVEGEFRPLEDGDRVPILFGPHNIVLPSLRAVGIDPRRPNPTVEVDLRGFSIATDIETPPVDMENDGGGAYVLWDVQVVFLPELCCFMCSEATLRARIEDASGRPYEGSVDVFLWRDRYCVGPDGCCVYEVDCPVPELTRMCE